MVKYYHGTTAGGLSVLKPFISPHANVKEEVVYLSANKAITPLYIWKKEYMWITFHFRDDGMPVYRESYKNALKELYDGVRGYIYTCEGAFSTDNSTGIKVAVTSSVPVPIVDCEVVENAYERIIAFEKSGELIIRRYEELTEQEHESNRKMVQGAIKGLNLLDGVHPLSTFVAERFPELWEEAKQV